MDDYMTSLDSLRRRLVQDPLAQADLLRLMPIKNSSPPVFHTDAPIPMESSTWRIYDAGNFPDGTLQLDPWASSASTYLTPMGHRGPPIQSGSLCKKRNKSTAPSKLRPLIKRAHGKRVPLRKTVPLSSPEIRFKPSTKDFKRKSANPKSWLSNDMKASTSSLSDTPPLVTSTGKLDLQPQASLIEPPTAKPSSPSAESSSKPTEKIGRSPNSFMLFRAYYTHYEYDKNDLRTETLSKQASQSQYSTVGVFVYL